MSPLGLHIGWRYIGVEETRIPPAKEVLKRFHDVKLTVVITAEVRTVGILAPFERILARRIEWDAFQNPQARILHVIYFDFNALSQEIHKLALIRDRVFLQSVA